jgi:predicted aspartyl protease
MKGSAGRSPVREATTRFARRKGVVAPALILAAATLLACNSNGNIAAALARDNGGRFTTQVTLNGEGPFAFIVDTGAARPVISRALAEKLKLWAVGGAQVVGASGSQASKLYLVRSFRSGVFARNFEPVVMIPNATVSNADGILGMNAFVSKRIEIDFADLVLKVQASGPAPDGFLVQPIEVRQGTFVIADVIVDGVAAKAVFDTGARRTIGNLALQQALGFNPGDARLSPAEPVGGATTDKTSASKAKVQLIACGRAQFAHAIVTFADLPVFTVQGLDKTPALLIGLDLLTNMKALAIDYPRSELQLKP